MYLCTYICTYMGSERVRESQRFHGHGLNCYFMADFGAMNVKLWLIRLELEVVEGGGCQVGLVQG